MKKDMDRGSYYADEMRFLKKCARIYRRREGIRNTKLEFKDKYV
jgi:hypothetical protein